MTNKQIQNSDKDSTESFEDLIHQLETITKKLLLFKSNGSTLSGL